ncbi:MAG: Flp pilus assembly complex ATPase component [Candidatus Diapherotrites archaeon]|nr:Flp pilus assembly complex ATPase component [Candidatus Diapherotrites archaeon]
MKIEAKADLSKICPYELTESKCMHCDPKDAPCVQACPKGAIYEVSDGILAIDYDKCDGCGKCVGACPYGAIEIKAGKAFKCDLCLALFDEPQCVLAGLARIKYSKSELNKIWNVIGWAVLEGGEYKVVTEEIRMSDAAILKEVVERYQSTKGEFTWDEILAGLEYEYGEIADDTKQRVMWWIKRTYEGYGPLDFLQDLEIEEIATVRLKEPIRIYIRGEGWKTTNLAFWTEEYFKYIVNKYAASMGRRITLKTPRVNATLPDGSRLHAVIPPLSREGHALTIRRFTERRWTPWDLLRTNTATPEDIAKLWWAIDHDLNIIIAGNTGSGKTTTLNAVMAFIPLDERIILVEETPEIWIPHPHRVRLIPDENTSMQELVYDTLRMRPDRVVVGEVRRPNEMRALFDTMLAGQGRGSYATMHGRTVQETENRIRSMGIPEEDLNALDVIVIQRRLRQGGKEVRRITEIEIRGNQPNQQEIEQRVAAVRKIRAASIEEYAKEVETWRRSTDI